MAKTIEYTGNRQRAISAELRAADDGSGRFLATLSSDAPIRIWRDLDEVLIHTSEAIDLARAADGLPLLWQHDQRQPIGLVSDLAIDGGKLRGAFTFAPNAKAQEVRADVEAGMLRNVSIGYRIHDWIEKDDGRLVEATKWELLEASIVSVPADPGVGINRAAGGATKGAYMPKADDTGAGDGGEFTAAQELARRQGIEEGQRAERERRNAIEALFLGERFAAPEYQAIKRGALDGNRSVDWAKDEILRLIGAGVEPVAPGSAFSQSERVEHDARGFGGGTHYRAGDDALEKFMQGAEAVILARSGLETDRTKTRAARESELGGFTLPELAREYCVRRGMSVRGLNRDRIVGLALSSRSTGVHGAVAADFPSLLENIAQKALLIGYDEPDETWRMIARPGVLTDFRQASRTGISEFDDLDLIRDGAEYKSGKFNDRSERMTLASYGKLFRLTRQAIVNDNLDEFSKVPRKMGRAASRLVGDVVYNAFLTNPIMNQDGLALFVAGHANLVSSGNGPPGVAQLSTMKTLMGRQRDSNAQVNGLNIRPNRVIVPLALEDAARTLQTAEMNPQTTIANSASPNIHRGTFETVADARLDAVSAVQWYAAADPMLYDTIEVGFLDGQQEPYIESQEGWTIDGVEFKVRIDCAATALDFRTMVRNNG